LLSAVADAPFGVVGCQPLTARPVRDMLVASARAARDPDWVMRRRVFNDPAVVGERTFAVGDEQEASKRSAYPAGCTSV
jgi:hypothetical protein